MDFVPRDYQQAATSAALAEWDAGRASVLIELPTGTGKTIVFALVGHARHWGKVLVLAPRRELIYQAVDKIELVTGDRPDIEMAEQYAPTLAQDLFSSSKYVVGSIQTVGKDRRMKRFEWKDFGLVVIDEGHHASEKTPTYTNLLAYIKAQNPAVKVLLVTATSDRADKAKLLIDAVAYRYQIHDAMADGWLVPVGQAFANITGLDLSRVHTKGGDLDEAELDALLRDDGGLLNHKIAAGMVDAAGDRRALIFTTSVEGAQDVAKIINRMPGKLAVAVDGSWDEDRRKAILADYRAGAFQFLVNCALFLEGWDEPTVEVVGMARPTKSRALYAQAIGRGLRPLPGVVDGGMVGGLGGGGENLLESAGRRAAIAASAKPNCLVVDLAGNSGRHKLVCTADVLGGGFDPAVVAAATKRARKRKTPVADMRELLESEKAKLTQRRAADDLEREARKLQLYGTVDMTLVPVDPFGPDVAIAPRDDFDRQPRAASSSQVRFLKQLGIDAAGLSFDEAQTLIRSHHGRKAKGLCTLKQKATLERHGIDASDMTKVAAQASIDFLRALGWAKPPGVTKDMLRLRPTKDGQFRIVAHLPDGHKVGVGPKWATQEAARAYGANLIREEVPT